MRKLLLIWPCVLAVAVAPAADTIIDDFEEYADTAALQAVWVGDWAETGNLETAGGAAGTNQWCRVDNMDSYQGSLTADNITTPPSAGTYKVQFWYQNGIAPGGVMNNFFVYFEQNGTNVTSFAIPYTATTTWTLAETAVKAFSADPITVALVSNNPSGPDPGTTGETAGIDEIKLIPVASIPLTISVWPDNSIWLGGTMAITATPVGGTGSYTKVDFEVNGTPVFTDPAPPFVYLWDTTAAMPHNTSGTVTLKATVTDSASVTGSYTGAYTVDNRWKGREQMVINNDFSAWTGNMPNGWVLFNDGGGNATYGPEPGRDVGSGTCLKVTFALSDYTNRYTLRTVEKIGSWRDVQGWYWGKGSSNRLMLHYSTDSGATWINAYKYAALVNNATWTFGVQTVPQTIAGIADTDWITVCTHQFAAGDNLFDDVYMMGINYSEAANVGGWNLY
ncbi:MAG: hypothetical protein WCK47_11435 [bacterium]|nr:hypothetical protein [Candidatus Sumerlaeota bacterium]